MTHANVRVPPDSTGKRMPSQAFIEFTYSNLTGDTIVGDLVTGSISGVLGYISKVFPTTSTTGSLFVNLNINAPEVLSVGETLTFDGAPPTGQAVVTSAGTVYYASKSVLIGKNNPTYGLHVDVQGAASVRFSEGSPLFDSLGAEKVSQSSMIGVYDFSVDPMNESFTDEVIGNGTVTYLSESSTVELKVTGANGDSARRTTNRYHFFWPGCPIAVSGQVAFSDTGVVGNTRRYGMYDDFNGVYVEFADSNLFVVIRSSSSGVLVNTRIPRSEWNLDKLDGTGLSGIILNPTVPKTAWLDIQNHGAGVVRFGIYGDDGTRVICHKAKLSSSFPLMQMANLPVRLENFNTAPHGATPSLRSSGFTIRNEGNIDYTYYRYSHTHPNKIVTADNIPLLSLRSKLAFNGKVNPVNVYPETYSCYVSSGTIKLDFCWPITLTNATWAIDDETTLEFDHAATVGVIDDEYWPTYSVYLDAGSHELDLSRFFEKNDEGIIAGGGQVPYVVLASKIAGTPSVQGSLLYKELR